jgi:protein gp37
MADKTKIEWSSTINPDGTVTPGATWNPIRPRGGGWSCVKVSPACAYCYAESLNLRLGNHTPYLPGTALPPALDPDVLALPVRWQRPRTIFVNSMTDTFWEEVTDTMIDQLFAVAAVSQRHRFLFLTKRAARMEHWFNYRSSVDRVRETAEHAWGVTWDTPGATGRVWPGWPLPNVWLGATVENQKMAETRLPYLIKTPAVVRFVSCEPVLGPITLKKIKINNLFSAGQTYLDALMGVVFNDKTPYEAASTTCIHWVIGGGESNGPAARRLVEQSERGPWLPNERGLTWARQMRDDAVLSDTAFFWKQWGGPTPKSGGRLLDGREWSQVPDVVWHEVDPPRYSVGIAEPRKLFHE